MTPFEVTVLSVTLNAAGIVPSANNRFPRPGDSVEADQHSVLMAITIPGSI